MDFDAFWALYPRRVAKADARRAWAKMKPSQQEAAAAALPEHVKYWGAVGTELQYIPYPASWLNGERYEDELQMPTFEKASEWWKTERGIMDKGRELGLQPRPGEEMPQFRERVLAAARATIRRVA